MRLSGDYQDTQNNAARTCKPYPGIISLPQPEFLNNLRKRLKETDVGELALALQALDESERQVAGCLVRALGLVEICQGSGSRCFMLLPLLSFDTYLALNWFALLHSSK